MRIAYLAHFRGGTETGIFRKITGQTLAWTRLGAEVGLFVGTSPAAVDAWASIPTTVAIRTPPRGPAALLREREALASDLLRWRPDVVYDRHGLVYPGLVRVTRAHPTVIEVNSDDLAEFRHVSPRRHAFARVTRGTVLSRAAGLVYVTEELSRIASFARYGKTGIVIANGIRLQDVPELPAAHNVQPRLVFMGHPGSPWHGVDHVEELARLFPRWHIDIVGPGEEDLSAGHPPNIAAHGVLPPEAYRPMLAVADVAVGTLGLYRNRMDEASPLKTREYLASGLPVIIGHRDTDFPDGAPFVLEIPNRPDGVASARDRIEAFVVGWMGRRVRRPDIGHLDIEAKEQRRMAFLESIIRG